MQENNVQLPGLDVEQYYVAISATTGDNADNHDVFEVAFEEILGASKLDTKSSIRSAKEPNSHNLAESTERPSMKADEDASTVVDDTKKRETLLEKIKRGRNLKLADIRQVNPNEEDQPELQENYDRVFIPVAHASLLGLKFGRIKGWSYDGSAELKDGFLRLTPDRQSKRGEIIN